MERKGKGKRAICFQITEQGILSPSLPSLQIPDFTWIDDERGREREQTKIYVVPHCFQKLEYKLIELNSLLPADIGFLELPHPCRIATHVCIVHCSSPLYDDAN